MLLLSDGVFFVERGQNDISVSSVPGLWIPSPTSNAKPQHRTLLDGIIVVDKEQNSEIHRFLIFDILAHEGGILTQQNFTKREKFIPEGVVGSRKRAESAGRIPKTANSSMRIRYKDHFEVVKVPSIVKSYLPKISHEVDGLVFVPKGT